MEILVPSVQKDEMQDIVDFFYQGKLIGSVNNANILIETLENVFGYSQQALRQVFDLQQDNPAQQFEDISEDESSSQQAQIS